MCSLLYTHYTLKRYEKKYDKLEKLLAASL